MAVLVHTFLPGITTEQYDTLNAKLQETPEIFEGCISHACVPSGAGLDIYDVWESEQHMSTFSEKVMAKAAEVGLPATDPGQPETRPVHNYWYPGLEA
ncbi:hypothetical protein AB0M28_19285 [Streptomyces sp. NPDC051940]|uniref:hypothetical protein n=1 Tax=Streptomyces sp. NPDC051940 TaxID=3155675 RepID=UPI00341D0B97